MVEESKSYFIGQKITAPVNSEREKLEQIAGSLGIESIDYKTDDQLRFLISNKLHRLRARGLNEENLRTRTLCYELNLSLLLAGNLPC
jgi:hypothetical protein